MIQVKFSVVDEFCEELTKEADHIELSVVRVTNQFTPSRLAENIKLVQVIATFVSRRRLVRLSCFCGDLWYVNEEADRRVMDKAIAIRERIEKVCKEVKLDVRAGVFEDAYSYKS